MKIVFTVKVKTAFKEQLQKKYPEVEFIYVKKGETIPVEAADVIVTDGADLTAEMIERADSLKWIMVTAVGVDELPLETLAEKGVIVTNSRGVHKMPLAESVLAHLLALERGLPGIYERQREKRWKFDKVPGEVNGSTAIIAGTGAIGGEIGRLLQAFNVHTIGCNRTGHASEGMDETIRLADLLDKLPQADYVISILPGTPQTEWIYGPAHFKAMKDSAVFINVGRGNAVKEQYVIDALNNGDIRHAVLDVFETEPLAEDSPLWELPNCTVSPHMSSLSDQYISRSLAIMETNLDKWLTGSRDLVNIVDLGRGY